jgi:hypothetical protein
MVHLLFFTIAAADDAVKTNSNPTGSFFQRDRMQLILALYPTSLYVILFWQLNEKKPDIV